MKKKLWRCGIAALALVLAAGAFACDKTNPGDSEKVSEAEWKAALSAESFDNVTVTGTHEVLVGSLKTFETELTVAFEKADESEKVSFFQEGYISGVSNATRQTYYETVGGITYEYMDIGDTWQRRQYVAGPGYFDKSEFTGFADFYGSMEYREGAYAGGGFSVGDTQIVHAELKFADKKLSEIKCQTVTGEGENRIDVTREVRLTYGNASVTLPSDVSGDTGEDRVTEAQWDAAVTFDGMESLTLRQTYLSSGDYSDYKIDFSDPNEKKIWCKDSDPSSDDPSEVYYVQKAGETVYTVYGLLGGEWISETGDEDIGEVLTRLLFGGYTFDLEGKFSQAVYITGNAGTHYYQLQRFSYNKPYFGPSTVDLDFEFEYGTLIRFSFHNSPKFEITYSDYNETSIMLPDFGV